MARRRQGVSRQRSFPPRPNLATLREVNHLEAILAANEALYSAFASRDMAAMEELWAEEAPVSCTHPGWMPLAGRENVLASWSRILANPDQPRVVAGGAEVHRYGDTAVVLCRELVAGAPLVATNVFTLEGGAWRLVHHHSSGVARG